MKRILPFFCAAILTLIFNNSYSSLAIADEPGMNSAVQVGGDIVAIDVEPGNEEHEDEEGAFVVESESLKEEKMMDEMVDSTDESEPANLDPVSYDEPIVLIEPINEPTMTDMTEGFEPDVDVVEHNLIEDETNSNEELPAENHVLGDDAMKSEGKTERKTKAVSKSQVVVATKVIDTELKPSDENTDNEKVARTDDKELEVPVLHGGYCKQCECSRLVLWPLLLIPLAIWVIWLILFRRKKRDDEEE